MTESETKAVLAPLAPLAIFFFLWGLIAVLLEDEEEAREPRPGGHPYR